MNAFLFTLALFAFIGFTVFIAWLLISAFAVWHQKPRGFKPKRVYKVYSRQ